MYEFKVHIDGDAIEDLTYPATFDERGSAGDQRFVLRRTQGTTLQTQMRAGPGCKSPSRPILLQLLPCDWAKRRSVVATSGGLARHHLKVAAVVVIAKLPGQTLQLLTIDIAHVVGDLFYAGDLEALTHLDCAHELGCFEQ